MTPDERDALIEAVTTAHRTIDPFTRMVRGHEAFHDLDDDGRRVAYERTLATRAIERSLDPEGRTTTVRAVMSRLRHAARQP
jgi:hypothetical protein